MKTTVGYKIWQIVYPIAMYYVVSSMVYFVLGLFLGNAEETYMLRQLVCSAITIPVVLSYYMQDKKAESIVYGEKKFILNTKQAGNILIALLTGAAFGVALNNVLAMTPLMQVSVGFQEANRQFFGGQMIFELIGSCLLVPIAEELLFRGVVYKRLRLLTGLWPALIGSALIFGVVHFNMVQFLYAGILGLLLAFLYEKTGWLYTAILAHIAANLMAVIRQETGWLAFAYEPTVAGIFVTALVALAGGGGILLLCIKQRNTK